MLTAVSSSTTNTVIITVEFGRAFERFGGANGRSRVWPLFRFCAAIADGDMILGGKSVGLEGVKDTGSVGSEEGVLGDDA